MKVVVTEFANEEIKSIHRYYKKRASKNVADKLVSKIFDSIEMLKQMPKGGSVESLLRQLHQHHRFILAGNYKIIFKTSGDIIYVTDVFDTRQNPSKIPNRNK